ncbi:VOC family protein [Devosia sp.]|uniref:VOC family protein n=1 Tax=Devosia sp. TaxID=1871048 RepID=UPI0032632313
MSKLTPCLWFDDRIEDAVNLYVELFKGKILSLNRMQDGRVFTASFEIAGQQFQALNGGPLYKFTEAISWTIDCIDQAEVDFYWDALIADGGEESQCGWLKDKFGMSWQVIPRALGQCLGGSDRAGADRAMQAMLKMRKLDVAGLEAAYAGK